MNFSLCASLLLFNLVMPCLVSALAPPQPAQKSVFQETPPLVRPLIRPKTPVAALTDGFTIDDDQTIVIVGSTTALEIDQQGYLETLLTAAYPKHHLRLRNMAWQADTVYEQQRPRNFFSTRNPKYGEHDGRNRTSADIIFFWMGKTESLGGAENIDKFTKAYTEHLTKFAQYTQRIVLVTPIPFSDPLNLGLNIKQRNQSLAVYVKMIKKIGQEKNLPVVDLFTAFQHHKQPLSKDGLLLSPAGHWFVAQTFAKQLGFAEQVTSIQFNKANATLQPVAIESMRQSIKEKNRLWFRYWRPTNWAFLYGNRQSQPSSRDHKKNAHRWFPNELQTLIPSIKKAESQIHKQAASAMK